MKQHTCEICDTGFDQRSRYERHMATSHPPQAPSAADLEKAIAGIELPKGRAELAAYAHDRGHEEVARILRSLPDHTYRDAAEVARAFGELRSHEAKPRHKPSELGGRRSH